MFQGCRPTWCWGRHRGNGLSVQGCGSRRHMCTGTCMLTAGHGVAVRAVKPNEQPAGQQRTCSQTPCCACRVTQGIMWHRRGEPWLAARPCGPHHFAGACQPGAQARASDSPATNTRLCASSLTCRRGRGPRPPTDASSSRSYRHSLYTCARARVRLAGRVRRARPTSRLCPLQIHLRAARRATQKGMKHAQGNC